MLDTIEAMPEKKGSKIASDFNLQPSRGSFYLERVEQIDERQELLPYAHSLRHAWSKLRLSGVLCVDSRPTVYFCEAARFSTDQKRNSHLFVWNQGLVPVFVMATRQHVEVYSGVKKPEAPEAPEAELLLDMPSLITTLDRVSQTLDCARLARSIETGEFFQTYRTFFPTNESVDTCLVEKLARSARLL